MGRPLRIYLLRKSLSRRRAIESVEDLWEGTVHYA